MANAYLQVIAHFFAKPGNGDAIVEPLTELAAASRTEPKNLYYEFFRSPLNADHFLILEQYSHADGLAEHRETEHFQRLAFGTIIPLLDKREVTSYMVAGEAAA